MSNIPQKRLEIFISSAQNPENGFDWKSLRLKIKKKLATCKYINPFIIEDVTSEIPSTQLFTYQVQKSDLIIFLLKSELRKGTAAEFAAAKKYKKPFLVYFIKENNPTIDVAKLREEIGKNDYCTYCGCLDASDKIENKILNDVIENVINYYQYNHFVSSEFNEGDDDILSSLPTSFSSAPSSPNKIFLSYFNSCYNYIYDLIGYQHLKSDLTTNISIFHYLGRDIIHWLIKGEPFYDADKLAELVEKSKELFSNVDWLSKRWEAIKNSLNGKYEEALKSEEEALDLARKSNMPEWIINDILIDCRNFENDVVSQKGKYEYGKHQQELDASSSFVYLPVADRFLQYTYDETIKEEIKISTQSHNTVTLGTNFGKIINHVENYLFSAIFYGSYTHIVISRQALARVFYKYGKLLSDNHMIYLSLSLYLLNGNSKEFRQILLKEWDSVYSSITVHADKLWHMTDNIRFVSRDTTKQVFISHLGTYLSEKTFIEAESYLLDFATKVCSNNAEYYFDCIKNVSCRLNQHKLIVAIIPIIEENRFRLGSGVTKILFNLDVKNLSDDILLKLNSVLTDKMQRIIKDNGNPQFIAALVNQRPDIFSPLAALPSNGLKGIQKLYYELNLGKGNWEDVLKTVIQETSIQYETNKTKSSYTGFAIRPFDIVANIMDNYYKDGMEDTIQSDFFPICVKILTQQVAIPLKDDCLMALCSVIPRFIKKKIEIPSDLRNAIISCEITSEKEIPFITQSSRETISLRLTILKVLLGISDKKTIFSWCFEYSQKDINDRHVLAKCILALLKLKIEVFEEIDYIILSMIFQFADDEYFGIRITAIECLSYLIQTKYGDMVAQKLYALALDPTPAVRMHLIQACRKLPNKEIGVKIIESLAHDADYVIRTYANIRDKNG